MRLLVTSVVDLRHSAHNRLHRLLATAPKGTEITILSPRDSWKAGQAGQDVARGLVRERDWKIIPFAPGFRSPRNQELAAVMTIPRILRELRAADYDLHFNYNSLLAGWRVEQSLASWGVPTIYDLADDLPAMVAESAFLPGWLRPAARVVATKVVRANANLATKVTVTTPRLGTTLRLAKAKLTTIPNGVELASFRGVDRKRARQQFAFAPGNVILGYVGVLREWVDFAPLFEAVRQSTHPGLRVIIAGREGTPGRIETQARAAGIADRVQFLGAIPYDQVPQFVNAIDIGLVPFVRSDITENAVCLKIFEYTAAGRPVLSTPLRPMVDIFDQTLWYGTTAAELGTSLREILGQPAAAARRVQQAEKILPDYDWATIGRHFWDVLRQEARSR